MRLLLLGLPPKQANKIVTILYGSVYKTTCYDSGVEFSNKGIWNRVVQVCLPAFTILGFVLVSLKLPQYGVLAALISQIFWLSAGYRAWKEANQIGILINTILATFIFAYGVINYWFL
jgi:hypothetical protein